MADDRTRALSVLLLTQGTYPFSGGGVSTWCDLLCGGLPSIGFEVRAVTELVPATSRSALPANVRRVTQIGQQSGRDDAHWLAGFAENELPPRRAAQDAVLERELAPLLRRLFVLLAGDEETATAAIEAAAEETGALLLELWRTFQSMAWGPCWRSEPVAGAIAEGASMLWSSGWHCGVVAPGPGRHDLATVSTWLKRFLAPLQSPLTATDLVHSSSAGPCVALGIVARRELGTPLLLTEHGIGARERYLRRTPASPFARRVIAALTRLWARAGYHHADAIATPTIFNRDWQIALGADPRKIEVVPNGVVLEGRGDTARDAILRDAITPPSTPSSRTPFTVIAVAAVRPIKDIETLIRAAAIVTRESPHSRFRVHGALDDRHYVDLCRRLIDELGLARVFELLGFTEDRDALYREADLAVLSSVSEAHPFALLEAMARGVPVVSTAVGGVPELLGDAGLLVAPRQPEVLAAAILDLARDPGRRANLGRAGRAIVEKRFSVDRMLAAYDGLYSRLVASAER